MWKFFCHVNYLPFEFMFTRTQAVDFTGERFRELKVEYESNIEEAFK